MSSNRSGSDSESQRERATRPQRGGFLPEFAGDFRAEPVVATPPPATLAGAKAARGVATPPGGGLGTAAAAWRMDLLWSRSREQVLQGALAAHAAFSDRGSEAAAGHI